MMVTGESPSMLFDLVMTRFEENYNPHIIYDASCLSKEYGYDRELRRFMKLRIMTDQFHQCNHTTCSDLNEANSEACEQVNSALRRITNSTTFMGFHVTIELNVVDHSLVLEAREGVANCNTF